jgi:P27 family predicted phage terminase small subunit
MLTKRAMKHPNAEIRPYPVMLKNVNGHNKSDNDVMPEAIAFENAIPAVIEVEPPEAMTGIAKEIWQEMMPHLTGQQALKIIDLPGFEAMCETYSLMCRAREALNDNIVDGKCSLFMRQATRGGGSVLIQHPALGVIGDCDRRLRQWLIEFGMTPASRESFGRLRPPDQEHKIADDLEIEKLLPHERDALRVLLEQRKAEAIRDEK